MLEQIAKQQPIGVSDLARVMAADKSAVQRAIMTLADEGWVHAALGLPRQWQLTGHIHLVAHDAQSSNSLRRRALPLLGTLRDTTAETAFLTVPDVGRFVVVEVVESRQLLRTAPHVGMEVAAEDSATARAVLPFLLESERIELLGRVPDPQLSAGFAETRARGHAVSIDAHGGGSINIAAPIFERDGSPAAALVVSAPRERLTGAARDKVAAQVVQAARELSLSGPRCIERY